MGGMSGEARGKSKIETYLEYKRIAESDMWADRDPPLNKKICYKKMVQDPEAEEWVLHFHVHT